MFVNGGEVSNENIVIFNDTELLQGQKLSKFIVYPKTSNLVEEKEWTGNLQTFIPIMECELCENWQIT